MNIPVGQLELRTL